MSKKYRDFFTSRGKLALAGKNAQQNEELLNEIIKKNEKKEIILHTEKAGSPFVVIIGGSGRITKTDIKEAAVFCARYSHDWRDNKKDVVVHYFSSRDVHKTKRMKLGTFGVANFKEINVNKKEIENFIKQQAGG